MTKNTENDIAAFIERFEERRRRLEARVAGIMAEVGHADGAALVFSADNGWRKLYLFPRPDGPGYQVSWADGADIPCGHEFRPDLRSAVASAVGLALPGQCMPWGYEGEYRLLEWRTP